MLYLFILNHKYESHEQKSNIEIWELIIQGVTSRTWLCSPICLHALLVGSRWLGRLKVADTRRPNSSILQSLTQHGWSLAELYLFFETLLWSWESALFMKTRAKITDACKLIVNFHLGIRHLISYGILWYYSTYYLRYCILTLINEEILNRSIKNFK